MTPPDEEDLYSREEKKYAMDEPDDPELEFQMSNESDKGNGEEDFIPIKRQGYRLSQTSPRSTESESVGEGSHQSSALRGAQEILKKNRRRRMEMYVLYKLFNLAARNEFLLVANVCSPPFFVFVFL